jgi:hypothetical protein
MEPAADAVDLLAAGMARCFGCRNRFGLAGLVVLECGIVCCRRCSERRELLLAQDQASSVEVIG